MIQWRFPSNDYGENKGINDSGVAMFKGTPLKSLVREICQNSLDAAIGEKVKIDFSLFAIDSNNIPGKNDLLDAFSRSLDFWGNQKSVSTKDFFNKAIEEINNNSCSFLRISDFNTSGLTGSRVTINTDWVNLTKSSGASDKRGTSGGSYGIGKYAPFACSYFSTVFYSTHAKDGENAYQGVSRLVTFKRSDEQNTQGIGYYGDEKNAPVFEQLNLDPSFVRSEEDYGTDIYIAGYRFAGDNWDKEIIISILDGFLGAIWNDKLEINVGGELISKESLDALIDTYKDELTGYTDSYYKVLKSDGTKWKEENLLGLGEVKLGLLVGEPDAPKRVAMIRKTGMKIMDKDRLPANLPFVGVMFINGDEINRRLRLIENPEHTKWEPARSQKPLQEYELLKGINNFIKKFINELISSSDDESVDAVGVGSFIPDDPGNSNEESNKENLSNKVFDVEVRKTVRKPLRDTNPNGSASDSTEGEGSKMAPEGGETGRFKHGSEAKTSGGRDPEEAHPVNGSGDAKNKSFDVPLQKVICICVDKNSGKYALNLIPDIDGENGVVELFLSAETQKYEAPIKSVSVLGQNLNFQKNKIVGVKFEKGKSLRVALELDFSDYCSVEVKAYAG